MATVRSTRYYENFNSQNATNNENDTRSEEPENTPEIQQPIAPNNITENNENIENESSPESPSEENFDAEDGLGTIAVQVLTASGTRPVSEAAVIIYKPKDGKNNVFSFALTDENGKTPNITAPAPNRSNSQEPSDTLPFADYNIYIRHPMYYTSIIDNVQVFGGEETIQTVRLTPLPEFVNELNTTQTVVIPKQNL